MNFSFRRYLSVALCSLILGFASISCSNDDNGETLPDIDGPAYAAASAKFVVADNNSNSDIKWVEFTEAGNYIIATNYDDYYVNAPAKKTGKRTFTRNFVMSRTSYADGIISGRYTVDANGVYHLDGFGTITVEPDGNAFSLIITTDDGRVLDINCYKSGLIDGSKLTDILCRTWNSDSYRIYLKIGSRTFFDKTAPKSQARQLVNSLINTLVEESDGEFDQSDIDASDLIDMLECVSQVIFSKSGTYMVLYTDNTLAVSTWDWINESKGLAKYSWDYDNPDNDYDAGQVTIKYTDGKLNVTEALGDFSDYDDDEEYTPDVVFEFTYMFTEAK